MDPTFHCFVPLGNSCLDLIDRRLDERNLLFQLKEFHNIRCTLCTAKQSFGKSNRIQRKGATNQVGHCRGAFFCSLFCSFNSGSPQCQDLPQKALRQLFDRFNAEPIPRKVNNVVDWANFLPDKVRPAYCRRGLLSAVDTSSTSTSVSIVIRDFIHHQIPFVLHLSSFLH